MRAVPRTGLWTHPGFLKLWVADTISFFGSQISMLALPLVAVLELDATAGQMGVLLAAATAPFLVFGLFAGVVVDRFRRRPILIGTDILRAVALATVPLAWAFGVLRIELLWVVAFVAGCGSMLFRITWPSYLPSLVGRERLLEGNSKIEMSASAAQIAGPGIGGLLVQAITAPVAIVVDAVSFIISALFLRSIDTPEPKIEIRPKRHVFAEIGEGLRFVLGDRLFRANAISAWFNNFSFGLTEAVYILFATRELGMSPAAIGLIITSGSIGLFIGAWLTSHPPRWIGFGPITVLGLVLHGVGLALAPLAGGPLLAAGLVLVTGRLVSGLGDTVYAINTISLRQALTPEGIMGRMNATFRVIASGAVPFGALLGGLIGEAFGLRSALAAGAVAGFLTVPWLWFSPWRRARAVVA